MMGWLWNHPLKCENVSIQSLISWDLVGPQKVVKSKVRESQPKNGRNIQVKDL